MKLLLFISFIVTLMYNSVSVTLKLYNFDEYSCIEQKYGIIVDKKTFNYKINNIMYNTTIPEEFKKSIFSSKLDKKHMESKDFFQWK